jgi:hypothetical protein
LTVAIAVLAGAITIAVWQQLQWRATNRAAAKSGSELTELRLQRAAKEEALAQRRRELEEQRHQSAAETAKLAKATHDAEAAAAPNLWAEPPAQLPAWDPASPYVWLKKEMLPQFPVQVLDDSGQLSAEVAAVLMVPPAIRQHLNGELRKLLEDSQAAETARAERTDEHLPGIAQGEGEKLTIKVPPSPEEGARLRQAFEATLRADLGEGRAALVLNTAAGWLDSHFSEFGNEARIVSVLRRPNGTYDIATRAGSSWFSTGGMTSLDDYVPAHLRPLFEPITGQPPAEKSGGP